MSIRKPLLAFALATGVVMTSPAEKTINQEADSVLRRMSARLAEAKAFSFKAEVWEDEVVSGHKISTTRTVEAQLRRPNALQMEVRSPSRSRGFWFEKGSLTILDRSKNLYAKVQTPDTIDKTLDTAQDMYNFHFPLEDFLVSDVYAGTSDAIKGAAYFGKVNMLGTRCEHVGFSTADLDWQLWVAEDGLPKKFTITYKSEPAQPQVTGIFSSWNLNASLQDSVFAFNPPADSAKIEILPADDSAIGSASGSASDSADSQTKSAIERK